MLYSQAFAAARKEGPSYLSTIHREYGIYLFDIGEYERGSSELGEAATLISQSGGDRSLQRRFQCLGMRAVQHVRHSYRPDDAEAFLREAQAILDEVHGKDFREEMREDLKDYRNQLDDARREVGKRSGRREIR